MAHVEAYQCDRCGALFSEKISALVPMKSGGHNYVRLYKPGCVENEREIIHTTDVDLCPRCINEFVAWYEGRRY